MEPLYGQKDLAEFCEFVIASLFEVAPSSLDGNQHQQPREGIDTPPYTPEPESDTPSQRKEPPALVEFIAYALYRTRLPISIVHQSLLLLSRLKQRYPSARGTSSSPHRLFLSSLMLSAKISMDDTYSNKSWAIVGSSFFPLREVNQMERELFAFLGWNVVVNKDELDSFVASAEVSYAAAKASKKAERVKRRRLEEDEARDSRHRQATNAARALLRPHTYRHSPSPTRSSSSSVSPSSGAYTPASIASPSMQDSQVASTSSHATSPSCTSTSSSHQQQQYDFTSSFPSSAAMQVRTPYTPSSSSSMNSSAVSSAFPSATHSPTSPASEPFSAGPQTPDGEFNYLHHHHPHAPHFNPQNTHQRYAQHQNHHLQHEVSSDFPEADSYMKSKTRSTSPPNRKIGRQHAVSPNFMHAYSAQQVQA